MARQKSRNLSRLFFIPVAVLFLLLLLIIYWSKSQRGYNPIINPANFVPTINNKYFRLIPGTTFVYENKSDADLERIEVAVTHETKEVMGVKTTVVWDRVFLNNELIEETRDWYAQDKDGNIWYFGEDSVELSGGQVTSRAGSWEAGVDGAKPGIIMKANPKIGETYRQEYYQGVAEDMAQVVSLDAQVVVPYGAFSNCLQTLDYSPLEPSLKENKFYCPDVGGVVLEEDQAAKERVELISVTSGLPQVQPTGVFDQTTDFKAAITQAQAVEIAQKKVSGRVTDVAIENKFGKVAYVVEIAAADGETDVIVDADTGEVVAIEK